MKKEDLRNIVIIPFVTNLLAVILGIIITFAVQEQIDKKHEMEGIISGLNLVKKELANNIKDLQIARDDMKCESYSANYLYTHINDFNSCPADSINFHWKVIHNQSYLTLPQDALQLLKSTYLYSDMLDRQLSLSVVRAYDICEALERMINSLCEHKISTIEKIDEFFLLEADKGKRKADIKTWISSAQGKNLLQTIAGRGGSWIDGAIGEIEPTIDEIDAFIEK